MAYRGLFPLLLGVASACMVDAVDGGGGSQIGVEDCPTNLIEIRLKNTVGDWVYGQIVYQFEEQEPVVIESTAQTLIGQALFGFYDIEATVGGVTQTEEIEFNDDYEVGRSELCGSWSEAVITFEFDTAEP